MKIFNTLSRSKEIFKPITENEVKIYVCGPTVYDRIHIGNARPMVVFDVLRNYLEYKGYNVLFAQNFTDIDDKIIRSSNERGLEASVWAEQCISEYYKDSKGLKVRPADLEPRATQVIDEIIKFIENLMNQDQAYITKDAVYFRVKTQKNYGKLSQHRLEDLIQSQREKAYDFQDKECEADFALWKFKKEGEPFWESPWGDGRPGWHIECSAMIYRFLGESIDIHGGGQDLIFPHHENEICQSEACNGHPLANYWMHNAFITIDGDKMSKSLGNFRYLRDIAQVWSYEAIRLFLLTGHYRSPLRFTEEAMNAAQQGFLRIYNAVERLSFLKEKASDSEEAKMTDDFSKTVSDYINASKLVFHEAMDDDLNTAEALSEVYKLIQFFNQMDREGLWSNDSESLTLVYDCLKMYLDILGLFPEMKEDVPQEIKTLVAARTQAKKDRNFAEADRLRDEIKTLGWLIKDTSEGPQLSKLEQV